MKIFIIAILTFTLNSIYSQNSINIQISDDKTKEVIPFCHINTENIDNGNKNNYVADIHGNTNILFSGKIIISISYLGYKTLIDTIVDYTPTINYKLMPETYKLNAVVITGQNKPINIDKSIYNIKIIGKETVELKASNNLSELLNNELNMSISNDPSTGSSVKLLGMSGENVKILIDGVPVIGRMNGNIDLSQINLDEIDHIEIVEGPMSVIYGSNALAGVINIITKENNHAKLKTGINTYYESVGTYNANGNIYLKKKNNSFGLNFGRNFFQGYSEDKNSRLLQWKPKEQYIAGIHYIYEKNKLKLKYKADGFKESLLNRNNPTPPYYDKGSDIWFYTNRINNSVKANYQLSEFSNFDLLLSYAYYRRKKERYIKNLTNLEKTLSQNSSDHDTTIFNNYMSRGVYNYNNEDKKISFQMGFDLNIETAYGKRIENGSEDIGDYAGFTNLQWKAMKNIIIQPALRASYNSKFNSPLTPSLNLKYQLKETSFRLSYSRGYRAPSLKELYLYFYDSNHQIEGNNLLKAENSHNFNLAISHNNKIKEKPLELRLTGFYIQMYNMITLVQVSKENALHFRNENIGEYESIGTSLSLNIKPKSFIDINIGASEIGSKDNYYNATNFNYSSNLNSSIIIKLFKNSTAFSVFYKYIGKHPQYYYDEASEIKLGYISDYHNMDITVSKKFSKNKLTVSSGIKNVFNNVSVEGLGTNIAGDHSGGSSGLIGWGRTFFIGLKYNFSKY